MSDTEAAADAAAAAGSNKRSRLNVAECVGDAADTKKSDQRKKEAKISESLMEWRMCTAAMAEKLMDPEHGPDMFNSPHLTEFKSLVEFISKRPDSYDLDIDDNEGGSLEFYTEAGLANVLAPDLIQAMQGWQFEPPEEAPVVQLVAIEAKKEAGYGKDDPIRRTISVSVSDASRRTIRGRLAVSAKGVERLRPGHIVRLNRFYRYVVRPTDKYDMLFNYRNMTVGVTIAKREALLQLLTDDWMHRNTAQWSAGRRLAGTLRSIERSSDFGTTRVQDTSGPSSPRCVRPAVFSPEWHPSSSSLIEFIKAKSLPVLSLRRDVRQMPMPMLPRRLNLCSPHRVFVRQAMSASLILFARKRTNHLVHVELLGFLRPSQSFSDAAKSTTSREVFPPGCVDTWSSPD